jgi:hypothetical protein
MFLNSSEPAERFYAILIVNSKLNLSTLADGFAFHIAFGRQFPRAIPIVAGLPALSPQT